MKMFKHQHLFQNAKKHKQFFKIDFKHQYKNRYGIYEISFAQLLYKVKSCVRSPASRRQLANDEQLLDFKKMVLRLFLKWIVSQFSSFQNWHGDRKQCAFTQLLSELFCATQRQRFCSVLRRKNPKVAIKVFDVRFMLTIFSLVTLNYQVYSVSI